MPPMIESSATKFRKEKFSSRLLFFNDSYKFFSTTNYVEYEPSSRITVLNILRYYSYFLSPLFVMFSPYYLEETDIGKEPIVSFSLFMTLSTYCYLVKKPPKTFKTTLISYLDLIWSNALRILSFSSFSSLFSASNKIFLKIFYVQLTASVMIVDNLKTFSMMNLRTVSCCKGNLKVIISKILTTSTKYSSLLLLFS